MRSATEILNSNFASLISAPLADAIIEFINNKINIILVVVA